MKRLSIVALLVVTGCCSSHISSDFQPGDAEGAIRRIDGEFGAAVHAGNASALAAFYADDAVFMPPNMPAVRGRAAIEQGWVAFLSQGQLEVKLTPDNVVQSGELATEFGRYEETLTPKAGAAVHDVGKYIVTWRKSGDAWKIIGDIFNSDLPAAAPPR